MRRALSLAGWIVGALLLLVIGLCSVVLVAGRTDRGRAQIERLTTRLSDGRVRLSGLGGSFPTAIDCAVVQLSDERGAWFTAKGVSLRWSPVALLARHVQVESLHAEEVRIERRPVATHESNGAIAIPHIDIAALSIDVLELGPQLAGSAASLTVHGNVHLRSLQDMAANVVARRTDGVGRYELQIQFDPAHTSARLQLHEPAGGPLENALGMPGLGALSVTGSLNGSRAAARMQLVIDAGALRGSAQGNFDLTRGSADLHYTVAASAATPRPGLAWQRLLLHGSWRGSIATGIADGQLQVDQLQLSDSTHVAALKGNVSYRAGTLALHAMLDRLTMPSPAARLLQDSPLMIDASIQLDNATRPLTLVATHRLFSLHAHAITADQAHAAFNVRLPDLAPLGALVGQDLRGNANLDGQLTRLGATTRLSVNGTVGIAGGTALWAGMLGNNARLQLSAAMTDKTFDIQKLLLTGRALSLSLSGSRVAAAASPAIGRSEAERAGGAARVKARWDLNVADMSALSPALAGTLKLAGRLDGPAADAVLTSTLSVRGSPPGTVSADVHANDLLTAPRATIQARGTFDGAPLLIETALRWDSGRVLSVSIRRADWKSLSLAGDLTSRAGLLQTRGQLSARCGELADLQPLLGMNLRGRVAGSLALTSLNDVTGRPHAQVQLDAYDVVAGTLAGDVHLTAAGATDAMDLQLAARLPDLRGAPASVSSTAKLNLASRELRVAGAEATYRGQKVRLLSAAQISFMDGLRVTGLKLGAQQAVLELEGSVLPALDLRASLLHVKPQLINAFVPGLLAGGSIEADAQLSGRVAAPTGRVQLNATGMRLGSNETAGLPAMDLHAVAQLSGDSAQIDASLSSGGKSQLRISGRAPLDADGALNLKLAGRADLGLVSPLFEASGRRVAGELNIESAITGTATVPQISGTINLVRGELDDYAQGIHLADVTAQIVGSQKALRIASFTARAAPGTLSMSGTIGAFQPGLPVDLELIATDAQPIASPLVTADLNADVHVSGTVRERLDVRGTIDVIRAHIGIPSALPSNVAVLDVRRGAQAPPALSDKRAIVGLDISLKAPRQIIVQGRGLDAELGGELHLGGTTDSLLVSGGFDLQRGSVSLGSSPLKFTSGRLSFNGTGLQAKIDPALDFTAEATVANIASILKITGFADAPRFELTSTPELPQDEILARLLFGTTAAQLGALQMAQIGAALATLSGSGSGLNPLARIQKTLRLDRLSVASASSAETPGNAGNAGNTGTRIEAGRYVSDRVYVGAKQSSTGVSQLEVDVNLSKHLKAQTRLGNGTATAQGTTPDNDPGSSIGLSYQFEY